jgi:hypothetical protein
MIDREQTIRHLNEDVAEARVRIAKALLNWENGRRRESHMPELPRSTQVWLPTGPDADLRLMNLCIWTTRYHVRLEWLLDAVLTRFARQRKLPRVKEPEELSLGLSAAMLMGDAARSVVEERIARDFPNGENIKLAMQARQTPMPDLPDGDMVDEYVKALAGRPVTKPHASRAYRRT